VMGLGMGYADAASERQILRNTEIATSQAPASALIAEDVVRLQESVHAVTVEEAIVDYMLAIVERTRTHDSLTLGVSPRGSQALYRAVPALAMAEARGVARPDDVKATAGPRVAQR